MEVLIAITVIDLGETLDLTGNQIRLANRIVAAAIQQAVATERERLHGLLSQAKEGMDYMEDRGYSSFRHVRSLLTDELKER